MIYSVAQINSYIKNMFAQDIMLGHIHVRGEVRDLNYHPSGHIFFTLKDQESMLACVMFAGNRRQGLSFRMREGQQVIINGRIEVFERDGKYQLYASSIKQDGEGDLHEQFERLKRQLEERGMFAEEYKQPIPAYIRRLGVVTAPTGAAVRDIINISRRRNPYIEIILYPALVQGEHAAESVAAGIAALDKLGVDVIIAGRGGGSMEDLWAFNEEIVAQAIFDCMTPIISAVGHETDFTIADFVADMRAPTPSAAAELAVYELDALDEKIAGYQKRMEREWCSRLAVTQARLEKLRIHMQSLSPENQLNEKRTRLLAIEDKMTGHLKQNFADAERRLQEFERRLPDLMSQILTDRKSRFNLYVERYKGLSPLAKLSRGYGYVADEQGNAVTDVHQVKKGDILNISVSNGKIKAKAETLEEVSYPNPI